MINKNCFVELADKLVAIEYKDQIARNFLPLLWQHNPRALLFCPNHQPAALMVRQVEKFSNGWRFPSTVVPISQKIYSHLEYSIGSFPLSLIVSMVNQSEVCLSFEFDHCDDKLLMAPYRTEFGLDPNKAIYFQGCEKDCQWLEYQSFIRQYCREGQNCLLSFKEFVTLKTPDERYEELLGFSFSMD